MQTIAAQLTSNNLLLSWHEDKNVPFGVMREGGSV